MTNPLKYHESIKNEKHVFLLAVSGRSSSTAFQRIINSSNQVWMWGEPHGMIKQTLTLIFHTKSLAKNESIKTALNTMYHSYVDNKHTLFYANAVGNLDSSINMLNSSISNLLKPWAPKLKRFGFKEIDNMPTPMLKHLKEIYPNSLFAFNFRNPLLQWPSLSKLQLPISSNIDLFLDKYNKMAIDYIAFAKKYKIKAFVENDDLRDIEKVNTIIDYLDISEIDTSLINLTVHSFKHKKLSKDETEKILNSPAYQSYLEMQKISRSFYKQRNLITSKTKNESKSDQLV